VSNATAVVNRYILNIKFHAIYYECRMLLSIHIGYHRRSVMNFFFGGGDYSIFFISVTFLHKGWLNRIPERLSGTLEGCSPFSPPFYDYSTYT